MQASQIPDKFPIPFAADASAGYITYPVPTPSQITVTPGRASLTDGFPPDTFVNTSAGGIPPWGQDFNGILFQSTSWDQWFQMGGPISWDSTFSSAIGGYPNGAIVGSSVVPGNQWRSTADNNTTNPDAGGAGWVADDGGVATGDFKWRPTSENLSSSNWLACNGQTIGSAASGASSLASAVASPLYTWLWTNFSNTQCPVTGGRGANAAADFAANKPIGMLQMQGLIVAGTDTMGGVASSYWNNVPFVSGSATIAGSIAGESLHTLTGSELPPTGASISGGTFTGSSTSLSISASFSGGSDTFYGQTNPSQFWSYATGYYQSGAIQFQFGNSGVANPIGCYTSGTPTGSVSASGTCVPQGSIGGSISFGGGSSHNTVQRSILGTWYIHL